MGYPVVTPCRYCNTPRPPEDQLLVTDTQSGETFLICRPRYVDRYGVSCFNRIVAPAARHRITPAATVPCEVCTSGASHFAAKTFTPREPSGAGFFLASDKGGETRAGADAHPLPLPNRFSGVSQ